MAQSFFVTLSPAGYPQYPNLFVARVLEGFSPGSPPPRPHPSPLPPYIDNTLPGLPPYIDNTLPGLPPYIDNTLPGLPPYIDNTLPQPPPVISGGPGWLPQPPLRPTHPIMLPGMPGWGGGPIGPPTLPPNWPLPGPGQPGSPSNPHPPGTGEPPSTEEGGVFYIYRPDGSGFYGPYPVPEPPPVIDNTLPVPPQAP